MTENVRRLLAESSQNTLEVMFFVTPDRIDSKMELPAGEQIAASLTFEGAAAGRFDMLVSMPAARSMAANFLGTAENQILPRERVSDVIGELANITCGATLSKLDRNASFHISAPVTVCGIPERVGGITQPDCGAALQIALPEGAMALSLAFEAHV